MRDSNLARTEQTSAPQRKLADNRRMQRAGNQRAQQNAASKGAANAPLPKTKPRYYYDYSLVFIVMAISVFGLVMIYSSSQYMAFISNRGATFYFQRQAAIGGVGFVLALGVSLFSYRLLRQFAALGMAVSVILLGAVMVVGIAAKGAQRWLGVGSFSFQPTEIAKIAVIVYLAARIAQYGTAIGRWKNLKRVLLPVVLVTALIAKENLSSGIIVAGIAFVMLFVACRQWKAFVLLAAAGFSAILAAKPFAAWAITHFNLGRPESYHLRRIFGWALPDRFPDDAYQTLQGLYAIGSGGLTGQGLGESIQKFGKLPEAQNDMIFSIICEELGFIGAAAVIILFICLIVRLMWIARTAEDLFGSMLCIGIMAHLSIQVILNISVVTGVIPNTGVTLPFISYGGTAVFFTMMEIGIALSVAHRIRLA